MERRPFLIADDGSGEPFQPVDLRSNKYSETWLQELLRVNPSILPVSELDPSFDQLVPIGREVTAGSGNIDNLYITPQGYLVLVETKLWNNPDAKRRVVAQAIEYGSALSRWDYARLSETASEYTRKYENLDIDLVSWVERETEPIEGGRELLEDRIRMNLRHGRFLTVIVADRIRESVVDMLERTSKYPHLATDFALIELRCYQSQDGEDWPLLVVPNIAACTRVVEYPALEIILDPDVGHQIKVIREAQRSKSTKKRVPLTESEFWRLLRSKMPDVYDIAHNLIDKYRERDWIRIATAESSIGVKFSVQDSGEEATLFYIDVNGNLQFWPDGVAGKLEKAGIDKGIGDTFRAEARRLLPRGTKQFGQALTKLDVEGFISAVDSFIKSAQSAPRRD